ncbi:MAG: DUF4080 domain-containing protein [Ruminococcaceae bacterium]|nr:DUF4080 domain-containing protein [Oscillospiraceae bacterium]
MALFVAINAKYVHTSLSVRLLRAVAGGELLERSINDSVFSVAADIVKTGERHILFSCYLWNIAFVLKVCDILKKADSELLITLGGPEVSHRAEVLLEAEKNIDHIICGEGETKIAEFIKNPPPRGVYRFDAVDDLDTIPFAYLPGELEQLSGRLIYYETSRGCPYRCAFCLSAATDGVRYKSIDLVKKELMQFIKAGVPLVKLVDRTFNADNRRACELVEFIKEHSKSTSFHFEVKAEAMSDALIDALVTAPEGMFQLEIGVQSTNPDTLARINRKNQFDRLCEVVKRLQKNPGIHLHLDLIAGLPGESLQEFQKSFCDIYALSPDDLQLGFLKKLSGTPIKTEGSAFSEFAPYEVIHSDRMSYRELIHLKDISAALERIYNSGIFKKTLFALGQHFTDCFSMFEALCAFHDFTQAISQKHLYEVVYAFCSTLGDENLTDAVIYDYCLRNRDIPSFMQNRPDLHELFFSLLHQEELFVTILPHMTNKKPVERHKYLRLEKIGDCYYLFEPAFGRAYDITKETERMLSDGTVF